MKATLKLDNVNHRFEFEAADFSLRFAITDVIQSIDAILEVDKGFIAFISNGEEEHLELSDLTNYLNLNWDFSKYDLEVLIGQPHEKRFTKTEKYDTIKSTKSERKS